MTRQSGQGALFGLHWKEFELLWGTGNISADKLRGRARWASGRVQLKHFSLCRRLITHNDASLTKRTEREATSRFLLLPRCDCIQLFVCLRDMVLRRGGSFPFSLYFTFSEFNVSLYTPAHHQAGYFRGNARDLFCYVPGSFPNLCTYYVFMIYVSTLSVTRRYWGETRNPAIRIAGL